MEFTIKDNGSPNFEIYGGDEKIGEVIVGLDESWNIFLNYTVMLTLEQWMDLGQMFAKEKIKHLETKMKLNQARLKCRQCKSYPCECKACQYCGYDPCVCLS